MGWLGKDKTEVIKGGIDILKGVRGMIDDSKFTEEERARQDSQAIDQGFRLAELHEKSSTPQTLTRRYLALIAIGVYFAISIFIVIAWKFDKEWAEFAVQTLRDLQHDTIAVSIIVSFFGLHAIRTFKNK